MEIRLVGYEGALRLFDPRHVSAAGRMALNEAARAAKKTATDEIYHFWNLKRGDVGKKVALSLARSNDMVATLRVRSASFPLMYFGAKGFHSRGITTAKSTKLRTRRQRRTTGVDARIIRGGALTHLPQAFIATMGNGHIGVFQARSGYYTPSRGRYAGQRGRTRIIESRVISVPSMFEQRKIYGPVAKAIGATWSERFDHHLTRLAK